MELGQKLEILAAGARYDASCASSGSSRNAGAAGGLGSSTPAGVCHSFAGDGRCVSLLKLLYSNVCRYDCAYCLNRASNEAERCSFTAEELVRLTMSFYRRNYVEGLFLSSGVFSDPDIVMERLVEVARLLREREGFGGYIHLKAIPGCGEKLLRRAGLYADRLSANIELPTADSLARLAPDKSGAEILGAMRFIGDSCAEERADRGRIASTPRFAPAGQSTQLVVGASPEDDGRILGLAEGLYRRYGLRRVYYSAFVPVLPDPRLPGGAPPLLREHRLYQADWLLRFYGFRADELLDAAGPRLPADLDPKAAWALAHPAFFPVELSRAELPALLRVPGLGATSARRILATRRAGRLRAEDLPRMGLVMKRAKWFLSLYGRRLAEAPDQASLRALVADRPELAGAGADPAAAPAAEAEYAMRDLEAATPGLGPQAPGTRAKAAAAGTEGRPSGAPAGTASGGDRAAGAAAGGSARARDQLELAFP
ncbi:MAG: putative DNA modification/repair radical SAM protein [Spirochaetaceae bacterium]|nr:putative DNA modification/repair radical SAM protein [Spirochaetaceae bacterium]